MGECADCSKPGYTFLKAFAGEQYPETRSVSLGVLTSLANYNPAILSVPPGTEKRSKSLQAYRKP